MGPVRLRAVPLQLFESKLGTTGESEMAEREKRTLMTEEFFLKEIASIYGLFIATAGFTENSCSLSVSSNSLYHNNYLIFGNRLIPSVVIHLHYNSGH